MAEAVCVGFGAIIERRCGMKFWFVSITFIMSLPFTAIQSVPTQEVNMQLRNTKVIENQESVIDVGGSCGGGKVLAFHLPVKGWFVCSSEPYAGYDFQKIARLDGNRISFTIDNREYIIISEQPINTGSQTLDLWVVRITPPADKADANRKAISCSSDFKYWLDSTLLREENRGKQ
jgi:hypothetical protein